MVLIASILAVGACDDTTLVTIRFGTTAVPQEIDSICLGIWDEAPGGGQFGQRYALQNAKSASLAVDPGKASSASVIVRGMKQGIEVARQIQVLDFTSTLSIPMSLCRPFAGAEPEKKASAEVAPNSAIAVSYSGQGTWIVAVSAQESQVFEAGDTLAPAAVTAPILSSPIRAMLALDVDGDCDDDLLILEANGVSVWNRDSQGFSKASTALPRGGQGEYTKALIIDFNGDLKDDIVILGDSLEVWKGTLDGFEAVLSPTGATVITGGKDIAAADLDEDGNVDLVLVGTGGNHILYGDSSGVFLDGVDALPSPFSENTGVAIADVNGDTLLDILILSPERVQAYGRRLDREYTEQTQGYLADLDSGDALGIVSGDWTGDCHNDVLLAGTLTRNWVGGGSAMKAGPNLHKSEIAVVADVTGRGHNDLLLLNEGVLEWWSR